MKSKKPYYLSNYLKFILPFVKPLKNSGNLQVNGADASTEHDYASVEKDESLYMTCEGDFEKIGSSEIEPSTTNNVDRGVRKKKRPIPEIDKTFIDYLRNKEKHPTAALSPALSQMDHFFKSILGDFETMTENQVRYFKIKTLQLIGKIKDESPTALFPSNPLSHDNCSPMSSSSMSNVKTEPVQLFYYADAGEGKTSSEEFIVDDDE